MHPQPTQDPNTQGTEKENYEKKETSDRQFM